MQETTNYKLKKPDLTDYVNVGDLNENMDVIDTELKRQGEEVGNVANDLAAHKAENVQHLSYATASGTDAYTVTINGINSLVEGMSVKIKFTNANTGASTLNINGLGAIPIKKSNGNDLSAGNIKAGQICHLVYTGSVFQLLGEGGEYGTARAQDVLEGKTIGTEEGLVTGTMPNNGAINKTLTTQGGQIAIPQGYHDGSGIVKAQFSNLVPENVKEGINIGGIVGMLKGKEFDIGTLTTTTDGSLPYVRLGYSPSFVLVYDASTSQLHRENTGIAIHPNFLGIDDPNFPYNLGVAFRDDGTITSDGRPTFQSDGFTSSFRNVYKPNHTLTYIASK